MNAAVSSLRGGRRGLTRAGVKSSQRVRLLDAMTRLTSEQGYAAVRIADVAKGAGVSLSTFYEHFGGKAECFAAAYDTVVVELIGELERVGGADPAERLASSLGVYLEFFAQRPEAAAAYLIEVHAAGAEGLARRTAVIEQIAQSAIALADGAADDDVLRAFLLLVDAIAHEEVAAGRTRDLPLVAPRLFDLAARLLS